MLLIEFYDRDVLNTLATVFSMEPERLLLVYDQNYTDESELDHMKKSILMRLETVIIKTCAVDIKKLDDIINGLEKNIDDNDVSIDLTGGSGLMLIAGYEIAQRHNYQLTYADYKDSTLLDARTGYPVKEIGRVHLDSFITAIGASEQSESHHAPEPEEFERIGQVAEFILHNRRKWINTCNYLKNILSHCDLYCDCKIRENDIYEFMEIFEEYGFIRNLYRSGDSMHFQILNHRYRSYLVNEGVWLELYTYIAASRLGYETYLGKRIDWNADDGVSITGNEIDVIVIDSFIPVFISCKMREVDTSAVNEVQLIGERVGGSNVHCIIVTTDERMDDHQSFARIRIEDLHMGIISYNDLLSPEFPYLLQRQIKSRKYYY